MQNFFAGTDHIIFLRVLQRLLGHCPLCRARLPPAAPRGPARAQQPRPLAYCAQPSHGRRAGQAALGRCPPAGPLEQGRRRRPPRRYAPATPAPLGPSCRAAERERKSRGGKGPALPCWAFSFGPRGKEIWAKCPAEQPKPDILYIIYAVGRKPWERSVSPRATRVTRRE